MKYADQPSKVTIPFAAGAGANYIRTVPVASQIGVTDGAASFTDGFPPDTFIPAAAGGYPPDGRDVNYILNVLSAWAKWEVSNGLPIFDSTFASTIGGYPKNAVLAKADGSGIWISTTDDNTSNPDQGGGNWSTLALSQGAADKRYAAYAGDANQTFFVADASTAKQAVSLGQLQGLFSTVRDVTSSRSDGTSYTNRTGRPMYVTVNSTSHDGALQLKIGSVIVDQTNSSNNSGGGKSVSSIVAAGASYSASTLGTSSSINRWVEIY